MWTELESCLPTDTASQFTAPQYAERFGPGLAEGAVVLDLGAGNGVSIDLFKRCAPQARWIGVDIESSLEVDARTRDDGEFHTYDGVNIPLPDDSVDLIYSRQVFEHVRHPEMVLADVRRVLKTGGIFIGSTSHLEPYHSRSIWNYTPYGFKLLVGDAGLELTEIRPGIDGVTLIQRAYGGNDPALNRWFAEESPLNQEIDAWAKEGGLSVKQAAFRKLAYCGQFAFWVTKT